ncbi:hypothetical protein I4F81_000390 [Pyropia yezoensis]|uniref:Uncharacterized protein n=1 Tax=Pyropia yezoensis TaxID=2788 RepID=A0ACC3BIN4_PYRYE|nr:hypothetical protein I4F81_000390 [Neopyropia yezoensis]
MNTTTQQHHLKKLQQSRAGQCEWGSGMHNRVYEASVIEDPTLGRRRPTSGPSTLHVTSAATSLDWWGRCVEHEQRVPGAGLTIVEVVASSLRGGVRGQQGEDDNEWEQEPIA